MLKIETSNICNARCTFCGYPQMERAKEIMSMPLFEKVIADFSELGGRSVTLTPCSGDILTDPHIVDRFQTLSRYPSIRNVSITSNLIAHTRLTDNEWRSILEKLFYFQVSLGALDRETYKRLYLVDRAETVLQGFERIVKIHKENRLPTLLSLTFRSGMESYVEHVEDKLRKFKEYGVHISNVSQFGNWGGLITESTGGGVPLTPIFSGRTRSDCAVMYLACGVLSSGVVTACSCCDQEGTLFPLGDIRTDSLQDIWRGAQRSLLLGEHDACKLEVCNKCTMGASLENLIQLRNFRVLNPGKLRRSFYDDFSGG